MPTGHVTSDLHIFSDRSFAESQTRKLDKAISQSEFFVFNGDIFDFRWSNLPSVEATMIAAEAWLRQRLAARPDCTVHYVLGNHDCLRAFTRRLDHLAGVSPYFAWHPAHLRIGTALFLHGDLALDRRESGASARRLTHVAKQKGRTMNAAYQVLCNSKLHRAVSAIHPPRRTARRLFRALYSDENRLLQGVEDVYFGHTHVPFTDFEYKGLRFHNTGSTVHGLEWNMLEVEMAGSPECTVEEIG